MSEPLLRVANLQKFFPLTSNSIFVRSKGFNKAVNGVSFTINAGETLGLVGESGCGKSTVGRSLLKLYEPTGGEIYFEGEEISKFSPRKIKPIRKKMQMIFQDPYSSLNPRHSIGEIIGASYKIHGVNDPGAGKSTKTSVQELMERVGLNPEQYNRYPHEF